MEGGAGCIPKRTQSLTKEAAFGPTGEGPKPA